MPRPAQPPPPPEEVEAAKRRIRKAICDDEVGADVDLEEHVHQIALDVAARNRASQAERERYDLDHPGQRR